MHAITFTEEIITGKDRFDGSIPYLFEDIGAGMVLASPVSFTGNDGNTKPLGLFAKANAYELPAAKRFDHRENYSGKTIALFRGGGFGDLLFLTPLAHEMKKRWPSCRIVVGCDPEYAIVLKNCPVVDETIEMPAPVSELESFDAVIFFENVIENNAMAKVLPAVDCYAQRAGFTQRKDGRFLKDPQIQYVVTTEEALWAQDFDEKHLAAKLTNPGPVIAVQARASSMVRTYPYTFVLIQALAAKGYNVLVFGDSSTTLSKAVSGVVCLPDLPNAPTFRQSMALMQRCWALIAPDSSLPHVAGALGMRAIALHGSFPGALRHCYSPNTAIIEGRGSCGPCFHHQRDAVWPKGAPCELAKFCVVLGMIRPEAILKKLSLWEPKGIKL